MEFYAGLASKVRGSHVPLPQKNAYGMVVRQPIGVCGGIVPWNFPLTLMGTKLGPALAAGNTIIIKPASTTPLATIKVIELIAQATFGEGKAQKQLPKGTVNIVTGPGGSVGEELLRNPRVRRIAFTGSTPVGRHVMEVAGREIKRVTLELGGSDPMIVMEDANVDLAVKMADVGRYFNCGQMCLGVKRLFLQESIADNFIGGLVEILKKKTVGNGMSKETRMGPIHIGSQRQEVEEQVEDAKARGGKVLFGGERPKGAEFDNGFFYLPTLMTNVPEDSRLTKEEVFGPALPVYTFKTLDEALEKANSSEFGLGSSIWTRNLLHANKAIDKRFAREWDQRQPPVASQRHALLRERRNGNEGDVEFGVGVENFMRIQIEPHRLVQHTIEIVFIAELGFALARLVGIAQHMMVGEQQAGADEKSRTVPGAAIARDLDPANRRGCPPAAIEEIDRHEVALADDALEAIRITLRRLDEVLAKGKPLVGLRPGASLAPSRGRDVVRLRAAGLFYRTRKCFRLGCYNVLTRSICFRLRVHRPLPRAA